MEKRVTSIRELEIKEFMEDNISVKLILAFL